MMDTATDERVAYFGRGYNLAAHQLMVCRTSALVAPATTAAAAAAVVVERVCGLYVLWPLATTVIVVRLVSLQKRAYISTVKLWVYIKNYFITTIKFGFLMLTRMFSVEINANTGHYLRHTSLVVNPTMTKWLLIIIESYSKTCLKLLILLLKSNLVEVVRATWQQGKKRTHTQTHNNADLSIDLAASRKTVTPKLRQFEDEQRVFDWFRTLRLTLQALTGRRRHWTEKEEGRECIESLWHFRPVRGQWGSWQVRTAVASTWPTRSTRKGHVWSTLLPAQMGSDTDSERRLDPLLKLRRARCGYH